VLREPELRAEVERVLRRDDGVLYDLHAYVVMPNYVHELHKQLTDNGLQYCRISCPRLSHFSPGIGQPSGSSRRGSVFPRHSNGAGFFHKPFDPKTKSECTRVRTCRSI
jgi:hypothetical protein